MLILGINAYHGDSAAAVVRDGKLIAAVEEERFRRIKHWAGLPTMAINYCLREAGASLQDVDHVALSRNPRARLLHKALHVISHRPRPSYLKGRISNLARISDPKQSIASVFDVSPERVKSQFHHVGHHLSHISSAFLVSPFEEATVISMDGFGDFASAMVCHGRDRETKSLKVVGFPHSLGLLYTAVTQFLGFTKYGDEYKIMGLASYGQPEYLDEMRRMIRLRNDGTFELALEYFRHNTDGVSMTWNECEPVLGQVYSDHFVRRLGPPRQAGSPITKREENLAASLQARMEEVYFHVINKAYQRTRSSALCLAGGVAFNSVANGKLFDATPFQDVYIQAAAGDAGTAVGAAFHVHHQVLKQPRDFVMKTAYWGPEFPNQAIESAISETRQPCRRVDDETLFCTTAQAIADGKVVGWFQGRMEWGPRALGNRSILADPRNPHMKDILNARIKRREPFRPFAPSVLEEATDQYFEKCYPDPFMIKVYPVKPEMRSRIPAVTHVDGTGRLQTVNKDHNPRYWRLIKEFQRITGIPMVLNTSFNENEPIVCTPKEALDCFLRTHMDFLAIGNYILTKVQANRTVSAKS